MLVTHSSIVPQFNSISMLLLKYLCGLYSMRSLFDYVIVTLMLKRWSSVGPSVGSNSRVNDIFTTALLIPDVTVQGPVHATILRQNNCNLRWQGILSHVLRLTNSLLPSLGYLLQLGL